MDAALARMARSPGLRVPPGRGPRPPDRPWARGVCPGGRAESPTWPASRGALPRLFLPAAAGGRPNEPPPSFRNSPWGAGASSLRLQARCVAGPARPGARAAAAAAAAPSRNRPGGGVGGALGPGWPPAAGACGAGSVSNAANNLLDSKSHPSSTDLNIILPIASVMFLKVNYVFVSGLLVRMKISRVLRVDKKYIKICH